MLPSPVWVRACVRVYVRPESYEGTHSTHIDCTDCESFGISHGRPKGKVLLDRRLVAILIAHTSLSKLAGVKLLH